MQRRHRQGQASGCLRGIRSTPTMIINNRRVIGTFPYEQLKAIFQALVDEAVGDTRFMENWVE